MTHGRWTKCWEFIKQPSSSLFGVSSISFPCDSFKFNSYITSYEIPPDFVNVVGSRWVLEATGSRKVELVEFVGRLIHFFLDAKQL